MPVERPRRLFFALWPDESLAGELSGRAGQAHQTCGGRAGATADIHLTLAFLGDIDDGRLADAEGAAAELDAGAVDLTIDRYGYWKHNRILWAGCSATPDALTHLVRELSDRLRQSGFALDTRPYAAHITLLRDARCGELPAFGDSLIWRARELVLAGSMPRANPRYSVLRRWPLSGIG